MKLVIVATAMLAFCSAAQAASECSALKNGKARLACFDKEYPANMKAMPVAAGKANPFAKEDALTTAKLNGICRGC
ncbi:hypothetical protein CIW50_28275 [Tardiphaga sp. P9-11]|jgi:hypothetical protein|nr:hypothetical protein CIW50_28275 [Tardiphaga sp. P9-11]